MSNTVIQSDGPTGRRATARVARLVMSVEAWSTRRNAFTLGLLVALFAAVKSGVKTIDVHFWTLESWPDPLPVYPPLSYGHRLIAVILQVEGVTAFRLIAVCTAIVAILVMTVLISRAIPGNPGRMAAVLLMGGPVSWVLWGGIGRTDSFVLLGGVLLATRVRSVPWVVLGCALMVLGNPEQAVLVSCTVVIMSWARPFRSWRLGAALSLGLSTVTFLALTLWSNSQSVPSRTDLLGTLVRQSLAHFFMQLPLTLYVGFGLTMVAVMWAILDQNRWGVVFVSIGCVVLPVVASGLTLDQTRVVVCCAIGSVTAVLVRYSASLVEALSTRLRYPFSLVLMATALLPAVEVTGDSIRVPWEFIYPYVLNLLPV